jgi:hypothetical protein
MNIKQVCSLLVVVFFLAACSSNSTPALNIDNDFWFGELTRTGSSGVAFAGFGFKQTGSDIVATLAVSDGQNTAVCCDLVGSLKGRTLQASFAEENGDTVSVSGTFGDSGKDFAGTLRFVVSGQTQDYTLEMAYDSELDAALVASFASKSTIESVQGLLE